jgi:hypothetical protein
MCCADGYFIDCSGPFAVNVNNANILKHILISDEDFKKLLQPTGKIKLFLDRRLKILFIYVKYFLFDNQLFILLHNLTVCFLLLGNEISKLRE